MPSAKRCPVGLTMVESSAVLAHTLRMLTTRVLSKRSSIPKSWRPHLCAPISTYALSSFLFSACGLLELTQCLTCPVASPAGWPASYGLREGIAVVLQGMWSYWSDVLAVGQARGEVAWW